MNNFRAFWLVAMTAAEFSDSNIFLLVAISFAVGGVILGWGITSYFREKADETISLRKRLSQLVSPDQLVSASQKIRTMSPQLQDRSPWHSHEQADPADQSANSQRKLLTQEFVSSLQLFFKYVAVYWVPYWSIGIASAVLLMSMPAYRLIAAKKLGVAIDQGASVLVNSAIQLGILLPIAFALCLLGSRLSARLSSRVANDIRHDLFVRLQALSQDFHKQSRLGNILSHFSVDIYKIEPVLGQELVRSVGEAVMTLINLVILIRMSASLTLISIVPIVVMLPLTLYSSVEMTTQGLKAINQNALMVDAVQEGMRGQRMIAGYGLQSLFSSYFSDELIKLEHKRTGAVFSFLTFQHAVLFSAFLLDAWVMGVGGMYVLSDQITMGTWIAFFTISHNTYEILAQLVNTRIGRWLEASIGMQRIDQVLEYPTRIVDAVDAHPLTAFEKEIRFENLSFGYSDAQRQLHHINLSIEAGQFIAFVGSSGAGKSTVFNLLMRFYDASEGRITIDGHDIRNLTQQSMRSQMGVVLQETFLFNTTIMNNIRIVRPEATDEEVFAAAQAAEMHDFILSLPQGYQTVVGDGGGRLSGGQRQRIAIAQALLHKPRVLLLDEPTSSLSPEMADAINQTIASLAGKHTVIMITHQLKASVPADCIFVLDQGRLVEQGTHEDLLARSEHYYHLWNIQQRLETEAAETLTLPSH